MDRSFNVQPLYLILFSVNSDLTLNFKIKSLFHTIYHLNHLTNFFSAITLSYNPKTIKSDLKSGKFSLTNKNFAIYVKIFE